MRRDAHWAYKWENSIYNNIPLGEYHATYSFGGADTTGAGWWEGRFSNSDIAVANLTTLDIFAPGIQVNLGHRGAGHTWVTTKLVVKINYLAK